MLQFSRRVQRLQPNQNAPGRSGENDVCHGMGCLRGRGSDVRIENGTGHVPGNEVTEDTLPQDEQDCTTIAELRHPRDAFERELSISQRLKASILELLNLCSDENPRT